MLCTAWAMSSRIETSFPLHSSNSIWASPPSSVCNHGIRGRTQRRAPEHAVSGLCFAGLGARCTTHGAWQGVWRWRTQQKLDVVVLVPFLQEAHRQAVDTSKEVGRVQAVDICNRRRPPGGPVKFAGALATVPERQRASGCSHRPAQTQGHTRIRSSGKSDTCATPKLHQNLRSRIIWSMAPSILSHGGHDILH